MTPSMALAGALALAILLLLLVSELRRRHARQMRRTKDGAS